jgi:hypothetical protein
MKITSAQYVNEYDADGTTVLNSNIHIEAVIDGETLFVPLDTSNRHYAAIKAKHDDADDSFTLQDAD